MPRGKKQSPGASTSFKKAVPKAPGRKKKTSTTTTNAIPARATRSAVRAGDATLIKAADEPETIGHGRKRGAEDPVEETPSKKAKSGREAVKVPKSRKSKVVKRAVEDTNEEEDTYEIPASAPSSPEKSKAKGKKSKTTTLKLTMKPPAKKPSPLGKTPAGEKEAQDNSPSKNSSTATKTAGSSETVEQDRSPVSPTQGEPRENGGESTNPPPAANESRKRSSGPSSPKSHTNPGRPSENNSPRNTPTLEKASTPPTEGAETMRIWSVKGYSLRTARRRKAEKESEAKERADAKRARQEEEETREKQ